MKRKGFTLIELMVVIAIIGLLAAIALPRFAGVSDSAKVANVQGNLSTLRTSIAMFHAKNDVYPNLVGQEDTLNTVNNSADGTGETFTEFYGKSVAPDTPGWTGGSNSVSGNAITTGTVASNNSNKITGTGNGGWAYVVTDGAIRADINTTYKAYGDDTDWSEF